MPVYHFDNLCLQLIVYVQVWNVLFHILERSSVINSRGNYLLGEKKVFSGLGKSPAICINIEYCVSTMKMTIVIIHTLVPQDCL